MARRGPLLALLLACLLLAIPAAVAGAATPNTGKANSPCRPASYTGPAPDLGGGWDTSSLGPEAPAAYELGAPTSTQERAEPVRRVMLLLHGGGWFTVGPTAVRTMRAAADQWRGAGWVTAAVSYRACSRSVGDVVRFYDLLRRHYGPGVPICAQGGSAGAHLALVLASVRDVACVIAAAAPTDLRVLRRQGASEADAGAGPARLRRGSAWSAGLARAAFPGGRLRRYSPALHTESITARSPAALSLGVR